MTINRRTKIIASIVIIVLIIVFGLIWWLGGRGPTTPTNTNQGAEPVRLPVETVNRPPSPVDAPDVEASLKAIAATFTERYGSFSNQSNFNNLDDLLPLLTVKMRGTIDAMVTAERAQAVADSPYYGITTQALVITITSYDEALGRAEVTVNTQRAESKGTTQNPRVFYQKIDLKLAKSGDSWKVDEARWQ